MRRLLRIPVPLFVILLLSVACSSPMVQHTSLEPPVWNDPLPPGQPFDETVYPCYRLLAIADEYFEGYYVLLFEDSLDASRYVVLSAQPKVDRLPLGAIAEEDLPRALEIGTWYHLKMKIEDPPPMLMLHPSIVRAVKEDETLGIADPEKRGKEVLLWRNSTLLCPVFSSWQIWGHLYVQTRK